MYGDLRSRNYDVWTSREGLPYKYNANDCSANNTELVEDPRDACVVAIKSLASFPIISRGRFARPGAQTLFPSSEWGRVTVAENVDTWPQTVHELRVLITSSARRSGAAIFRGKRKSFAKLTRTFLPMRQIACENFPSHEDASLY